MGKNLLKYWLLTGGIILSLFLAAYTVENYRSALPIAEGNLRGLALTLSSAIESIADKDPSLKNLTNFKAADIAYFAILEENGTLLFHSNPALIAGKVPDQRYKPVFSENRITESRVRLGTGEEVFEFNTPVHLPGQTLTLRLSLHTYREDAVIRRAQIGMAVLFSLLAAAWILGIFLYRYARREEKHKVEMARRERLAQLGEMGAILAHEVRNPLSGIKGFAQLLQEQLSGEEPRHFANMIVIEAGRLELLVNDLLAYTRQEPPTEQVDAAHVLRRCLEMIETEAARNHIEVKLDCTHELMVVGNYDRMVQLFLNLFGNGVQAMPDGGCLEVQALQSKHEATITISDSGTGIASEDLGRIFEPFFTTKARGAGLGLAISQRIIEEMGGTITVTSLQGQGTTFHISLPLLKKHFLDREN